MDTTFMHSGNSKASYRRSSFLNLSDRKTQKEVINMLLYIILAFTIHGKI